MLAILGMGLVSPFGRSPREHVFFQRAQVPGPFPPSFVRADDRPVRVYHCPWLDAALAPAERLAALAMDALDDVLVTVRKADLPAPALRLCLARTRPGLGPDDHRAVVDALVARYRPPSVSTFFAEASVFVALHEAERELGRNEMGVIALVAVDSHVSLGWLTHHIEHPPTRWESPRPTPSEAAAVLVVMNPRGAHRLRLPVLGHIQRSAAAMGASNDDNDEIVDGAAMGKVLDELGSPHVPFAFGQGVVDALRREEWYRAVARRSTQFWECQHECVESDIGAVGAAAGAVNLVYGAAMLRHGAIKAQGGGTLLAWAISRDGLRGAARVSVEGS